MEIDTRYKQYRPSAFLSGYIECYWVWRGTGLSGREERLIPGGRVELIFNFGDAFRCLMESGTGAGTLLKVAHFMGQRDRLFFCQPCGRVELFGVRFKPGSWSAFSRAPLTLLLNRVLAAEELFGPEIKDWEGRLYAAVDDSGRVRLIEELLCGMLAAGASRDGAGLSCRPLQTALEVIRQSDGMSVESVCEHIGWGYKRMERAFLKEVGYTPKGYSRIIRFNKAIRRMDREGSLTQVGYACGYYDQAHFIKDFYRFAGVTPGQFRVEEHPIAKILIQNQVV